MGERAPTGIRGRAALIHVFAGDASKTLRAGAGVYDLISSDDVLRTFGFYHIQRTDTF